MPFDAWRAWHQLVVFIEKYFGCASRGAPSVNSAGR